MLLLSNEFILALHTTPHRLLFAKQTFEQKKRLSIAVELAASPSVVFLDEPTSGLDARAALLVMTALKKMCDTGRTIVATIHQPSSAVFDMFDDLLLLKKGGEVVFFGDLGSCSCNLVSYFEGLGASNMNKGENPATWMLNVLGEKIVATGDNGGEDGQLNFARAWENSSNYVELKQLLAQVTDTKDESCLIQYDTEFAVGWWKRDTLMARRLVTIYWRSPAYNLGRCVSQDSCIALCPSTLNRLLTRSVAAGSGGGHCLSPWKCLHSHSLCRNFVGGGDHEHALHNLHLLHHHRGAVDHVCDARDALHPRHVLPPQASWHAQRQIGGPRPRQCGKEVPSHLRHPLLRSVHPHQWHRQRSWP